MTLVPRVVLVTRHSVLEDVLARHGTRQQAAFFLRSRGQDLDEVERWHQRREQAVGGVLGTLPRSWRRTRLGRDQLSRFLFEPNDIVVAVGQDGLVANVAKYLDGQVVIGVNPDPERLPGVLVRCSPELGPQLVRLAGEGQDLDIECRTMVQARLDDGQVLRALNEIFVGHPSHQSARYRIRIGEQEERHSSSGVIVSTGTGATGWASSICRQRHEPPPLPRPTHGWLAFFVREAWASPTTGTQICGGAVADGEHLMLTSEMPTGGVVFGDGIESDALAFPWGERVAIGLAPVALQLARPPSEAALSDHAGRKLRPDIALRASG
jgi:hypothetical protein